MLLVWPYYDCQLLSKEKSWLGLTLRKRRWTWVWLAEVQEENERHLLSFNLALSDPTANLYSGELATAAACLGKGRKLSTRYAYNKFLSIKNIMSTIFSRTVMKKHSFRLRYTKLTGVLPGNDRIPFWEDRYSEKLLFFVCFLYELLWIATHLNVALENPLIHCWPQTKSINMFALNPFTKISSIILLNVCHTILMMLVRRTWYLIN